MIFFVRLTGVNPAHLAARGRIIVVFRGCLLLSILLFKTLLLTFRQSLVVRIRTTRGGHIHVGRPPPAANKESKPPRFRPSLDEVHIRRADVCFVDQDDIVEQEEPL